MSRPFWLAEISDGTIRTDSPVPFFTESDIWLTQVVGANAVAAGSSTAQATSSTVRAATGTSTGLATLTATGAAVRAGVGTSTGLATVTATGAAVRAGVGATAGLATVTATGAAVVAAIGSASGTSNVLGAGSTGGLGSDATAAGVATVSGIGAVWRLATANAAGVATVSGNSATIMAAVGTSAGVAAVDGVPVIPGAIVEGVGTSAGLALVIGRGEDAAIIPGPDGHGSGPRRRRRQRTPVPLMPKTRRPPVPHRLVADAIIVSVEVAPAVFDLRRRYRIAAENVAIRYQVQGTLERRWTLAARPCAVLEPRVMEATLRRGWTEAYLKAEDEELLELGVL